MLDNAIGRVADVGVAGDVRERGTEECERFVVGDLFELTHSFDCTFIAQVAADGVHRVGGVEHDCALA